VSQTSGGGSVGRDVELKFTHAALNGDVKEVRSLLAQGVKLDVTPENGWTALMNASLSGHLAVVSQLEPII